MEKVFLCSLCKNGILGGALYVSEDSIVYKTQKLSIEDCFKNLVLPISNIKEIRWNWLFASIVLKTNESYTFLIFNKYRFMKWYRENKNVYSGCFD